MHGAMPVDEGRFAIARHLLLDDEDRLRRQVIERLMCDLEVDLSASLRQFDRDMDHFSAEVERIDQLAADGIAERDVMKVRVPEAARPLVRMVAAVFDQYLTADESRHARAV